eukprot:UN05960
MYTKFASQFLCSKRK